MTLSLFDNLNSVPSIITTDNIPHHNFDIEVNGIQIPVRILFESRLNNRVSVSKSGILLRLANRQPKEEQRKSVDELLKWAKEKLDDKPHLLESLPQRQYVNGEILKVGEHHFYISIYYNDQKKSSAKIFNNNILISLAKGLTKESEGNTCSYLVSRCLCKHFQPIVADRLHELNSRFFKKQINHIRLKYATSFWGHCSRNGQIVISVRLMFAPMRVVDYVLIHELAHLVHHDHSHRFWKVVEQIAPDYRNAEKHLKDNHLKYYL